MKKSEIIKKELWLTYKDPEYYKYYHRLKRYWRLEKLEPVNIKNMSKEELYFYLKQKRLWIKRKQPNCKIY